jgi:hypothetical protein
MDQLFKLRGTIMRKLLHMSAAVGSMIDRWLVLISVQPLFPAA